MEPLVTLDEQRAAQRARARRTLEAMAVIADPDTRACAAVRRANPLLCMSEVLSLAMRVNVRKRARERAGL